MKPKFALRNFLACAGSALLLSTQAQAIDYYWDSNGATSTLGNTGGLSWQSATTFNYVSLAGANGRAVLNGTLGLAAAATTTSDSLSFGIAGMSLGAAASNITVNGTQNIGTIVFGFDQSNAVTLSGGTAINFAAAGTIAVNNAANTISTAITGAATSLTKSGSGTLTLTGASTFAGTAIVSGGGILNLGDGTSGDLSSTTNALTFNSGGGTFNVAEAAGSTEAMGALTFSAGDGIVKSTYGGSGNSALTFSSLVARTAGATGNFVISGGTNGSSNKIVLTGAATGFLDKGLYFGGSSFAAYDSGGYVRALNYATTGGDANTVDPDTISASKHVQLTTSPASRVGDTLLSLHLAGSGVNYSLSSGSLTVPAILKSGGGTVSTISGGTSVTTASNAELVIRTDTSSDLLAISTNVTGFSGGLTKTGAGTLTLSGTNGYTGTTNINAGTLEVSGGNAIADANTVNLANSSGATLKLSGNETFTSLTGGGFSGGDVNIGSNTLTLSNPTGTFGGKFSGAGNLIKNGAGTFTLSNKHTFAGNITLTGGILQFTYGSDGTTPNVVTSGGSFDLSGGAKVRFNPTGAIASGQPGGQLSSPGYFSNSQNFTISSGTGALDFGANGNRYNMSGTFSGGASGSQTLAVSQGITGSGGGDIQNVLISGVIQDGSGGTLGVTVDFTSSSSTAQGAYVNLSNTNTFTGPLVVNNTRGLTNGAYLTIGGETSGAFASPTITPGTGSLGSGNYTNTISLATGTILHYASSANQSLGGDISGAGRILKNGSGILTLSGTNSYGGGSTISSGALVFRNTAAKSGTGTHAFAAGTTLGLGVGGSGYFGSADITSAFGSGTILTNVTVTATTHVGIDTTAGDFTHSTDITGSPTKGLTKLGTNTLTLQGVNTYTGATNVNAGTLAVSGSGSINSTSAINVESGARFVHNSSTALTKAPTLNGNGASNRAVLSGGDSTGTNGAINATLTLNDPGDVLSPGNSPGILPFAVGQTWLSNSYDWELNSWSDAVAGTNADQITVNGTLDLSAVATSQYFLNILSLTGGNATGALGDFSESSKSWTIIAAAGGISGFSANEWQINTTGSGNFSTLNGSTGTWSLGLENADVDPALENLVLTYTPIPEPGATLLGGLGMLLILRRRR